MPPGMPHFMVGSSATKKGTDSLRPYLLYPDEPTSPKTAAMSVWCYNRTFP